jgi:hypothetical protein
MQGKVTAQGALGDLVELFAKALLSGIGVAVALSLAILALSATAQASPDEPERGNQPWSVAPTPPQDADAAGVGALWAIAAIAERLP